MEKAACVDVGGGGGGETKGFDGVLFWKLTSADRGPT